MSLPLVMIVGPTAVGKTQLAIEIASALNGEIISADSRLIYRGMDIGTAKPSARQMDEIQHYLIDICQPDHSISIAEFQMLANQAIEQIFAHSRLPIIVGGTGQYIHALLYQWIVPQVAPNHRVRTNFEMLAGIYGPGIVYQQLAFKDADWSLKIDWRNTRRVIRALEIVASAAVSGASQFQVREKTYVVGLTRPRDDLYARIDQRIMDMFDLGFVREVAELLKLGYSPTLPSMSSVGYAQVSAYLRSEKTMPEVIASMRKDTRRLVRMQYNWFSPSDPLIHWYDLAVADSKQIITDIKAWLEDV